MANDLDRLSRKMRQTAIQIETGATAMTRKVALVIDQTLVIATPVDTGRARSNWVVEVGKQPTRDTREPYSPGDHGSTGAANASAAIAQGQRAVMAYNREDEYIFITNNLHYIKDLNEGKSPQAPPGFVQTAIARGVSVARGFTILRSSS